MPTTIKLTVVSGPHAGQRFCFRGRARCLAGRSKRCYVRLSGKEADKTVSRYHCLFEVNLPFIRVKDLDSANGTFINGERLRPSNKQVGKLGGGAQADTAVGILKNGDVLRLGAEELRVDVMDCPPAFECGGDDPPIWKDGKFAMKSCNILC